MRELTGTELVKVYGGWGCSSGCDGGGSKSHKHHSSSKKHSSKSKKGSKSHKGSGCRS